VEFGSRAEPTQDIEEPALLQTTSVARIILIAVSCLFATLPEEECGMRSASKIAPKNRRSSGPGGILLRGFAYLPKRTRMPNLLPVGATNHGKTIASGHESLTNGQKFRKFTLTPKIHS